MRRQRKKRNKYGAKPTVVDNIRFASMAEARRYKELKIMLAAKEIFNLKLQPRFPLHSKTGEKICDYVADFQYNEQHHTKTIVEDVKGKRTRDYIIKSKFFQSEYPEYDFREVKA